MRIMQLLFKGPETAVCRSNQFWERIVIVSDGSKALDYCITRNGDQARKTLLSKRIKGSVNAA